MSRMRLPEFADRYNFRNGLEFKRSFKDVDKAEYDFYYKSSVDFFHRAAIDLDKPRPCPCCGSDDIRYEEMADYDDTYFHKYLCFKCGVNSGWEYTEKDALTTWNTRIIDKE